MGAAPIGAPGCPERAFWTVSTDKSRMVFMQSWSRAETVKAILYAISSGPVLRLAQDSTEQNQEFCTARFRPELFHQPSKGARRVWLSRHFDMVSKGA